MAGNPEEGASRFAVRRKFVPGTHPKVNNAPQSQIFVATRPEVNTAYNAQANPSIYPEIYDNRAQPRTASVISPEVNTAAHAQDNSSVYPEVNPINHPEIYDRDQDGIEGNGNEEFTAKEQSLIIHRIDRRLVAILGVLYAVSVMDKINISFALSVYYLSFDRDLYTVANTVYFSTYVFLQPVATAFVRILGSRPFLGGLTLAFGLVTLGMGFVHTIDVLAGLRVLLGALQAGILSCSIYLISSWYQRYDVGKRFAFFYSFGLLAVILTISFLIGSAFLVGTDTLWLVFIVEGAVTCVVAIIAYFFIVDFPDKVYKKKTFLTGRETRFILERINEDRGDSDLDSFKLSEYLRSGLDLKVWGFALLFFANTTVAYSLRFIMPIVLLEQTKVGGWGLLVFMIGALVFTILVTIITGIIGDRTHTRGPIILINALFQFIGSAMVGYSDELGVQLTGFFLTVAGANANLPAIMAYQANNIRGQWKRALTSAILVAFGGIGDIAGIFIFRFEAISDYYADPIDDIPIFSDSDSEFESDVMESARHGAWATMICALLSMAIVGLLSWQFWLDNRKEARGEKRLEKSEAGFRYTY